MEEKAKFDYASPELVELCIGTQVAQGASPLDDNQADSADGFYFNGSEPSQEGN